MLNLNQEPREILGDEHGKQQGLNSKPKSFAKPELVGEADTSFITKHYHESL